MGDPGTAHRKRVAVTTTASPSQLSSKPREERPFTDFFPDLEPDQALAVCPAVRPMTAHPGRALTPALTDTVPPSVPASRPATRSEIACQTVPDILCQPQFETSTGYSTPNVPDDKGLASQTTTAMACSTVAVSPQTLTLLLQTSVRATAKVPAPSRHLVPKKPAVTLPQVRYHTVDMQQWQQKATDAMDQSLFGAETADFKRPESHYIRNVELSEAELADKIEYDMDEEDQSWLDLVNRRRTQQGLNAAPRYLFEKTMDRLEKEWFDLTKQIQRSLAERQHEQLPPEESACNICGEEECENSNAIVFCDGCNLAVHQDCYGVPYIPEGQWLCRRCMISPETRLPCLFCPYADGAFKKTTTNKWAHLLCALWIPEVTVANTVYMEPIDNIDHIPKSRWRLVCSICRRRKGACIQCTNKSCYTAYHVTCARKAKLYLKMKTHKYTGEPIFRSFCDRHSPPDHDDKPDFAAATEALAKSDAELDRQNELYRSLDPLLSPAPTGASYGRTSGPDASDWHHLPAYQHYQAMSPVIPQYVFQRVLYQVAKPAIRLKANFVQEVARYWSLKRQSRRGAPLIKRLHLEPWTASASQQKAAEMESDRQYAVLRLVRKDLERIRMLVELVRKRERQKLKRVRLQHEYLEGFLYPLSRVLTPVLDALQAADPHDFFAQPVSTAYVPDYLDVVQNPMDFGTMRQRLQAFAYRSLEAFEADARLVCANAMLYNKPDTPYYKLATRLQRRLEELMAEARQRYQQLPLDPTGTPLIPPSPLIFDFGELPFPSPATLAGRPSLEQRSRTSPSAIAPPEPPSPRTPHPGRSLTQASTGPARRSQRLAPSSQSTPNGTPNRKRRRASRSLDPSPSRALRPRIAAQPTATPSRTSPPSLRSRRHKPVTPLSLSATTPTVKTQATPDLATPSPFFRQRRLGSSSQRSSVSKELLSPGAIVWAKLQGFPWFPAEIWDTSDSTVPDAVQQTPHNPGDKLVRFYDRDSSRRTFAWVGPDQAVLLGQDEAVDRSHLNSAKSRRATQKRQVFRAYDIAKQILVGQGLG
ncbi:hypothetical protein H4R35_001777 [Dimargaris xerosporica]|nr:hypothetical protein H4R35_001777 [Dimargaris xerosporica]